MCYMTLYRFEQIKWYFHISPPTNNPQPWYIKLSPLFEHLWRLFKQFYIPSQNVSVDEMMVLCTGRSLHTVRMPNKPVGEGYKIFALYDHGYTWDFLFTSRSEGKLFMWFIVGFMWLMLVGIAELNQEPLLSPTSSAVLQLAKTLPYESHEFSLFCDNLFSKLELFSQLKELGIRACGTTR